MQAALSHHEGPEGIEEETTQEVGHAPRNHQEQPGRRPACPWDADRRASCSLHQADIRPGAMDPSDTSVVIDRRPTPASTLEEIGADELRRYANTQSSACSSLRAERCPLTAAS